MASVWAKARRQKVVRPVRVISNLDPEQRRELADDLGAKLASAHGDALEEAWLVMERVQHFTRSLVGEVVRRKFSWLQILRVTARKGLDIKCRPTWKADRLEREIFNKLAARVLERLNPEQRAELDEFEKQNKHLFEVLRKGGLRPGSAKMVLWLAASQAKKGGFKTYIRAVKTAGWLNRHLGTKLVMKSVTHSLKLALKTLNAASLVLLTLDVLEAFFGRKVGKNYCVVVAIHLAEAKRKLGGDSE